VGAQERRVVGAAGRAVEIAVHLSAWKRGSVIFDDIAARFSCQQGRERLACAGGDSYFAGSPVPNREGLRMDWHPLVVHYPIALWSAGFGVDLVARVRHREDWHGFAYVLQILAAAGALAAVLTGTSAAAPFRDDEHVADLVKQHEDWATLTLFYLLAVVLARLPLHLRGLRGRRLEIWVVAAGLGAVGVWLTAHYGGKLVYEQGVGVRQEQRRRQAPGGDDAGDPAGRSGPVLERAGKSRTGHLDGPGRQAEHDRGRLADAGEYGAARIRHRPE